MSATLTRTVICSVSRSRCLSTSALLRAEQTIKSPSSDPSKPFNPSPPPRAAASTPPSASSQDPLTQSSRPPSAVAAAPKHSEFKKKLVRGIARLMGYNTKSTIAIRVTSDLYDRCAERWELDKQFWQGECHLPPTYQSWFQVTNIHVTLLLLRFRAFETKESKLYQQEIINHFFIDAEYRMRQRFGVQTSRLVKGYMKEMHSQHRGALLAFDESMAILDSSGGEGDLRVAMTLWRNVFGAGWGDVGGVLSKVRGVDKSVKGAPTPADGKPELAKDAGFTAEDPRSRSPYAAALAQQRQNAIDQGKVMSTSIQPANKLAAEYPEIAFPIILSRLTKFFLRELRRLAAISDHEMQRGSLSRPRGPRGEAPAHHVVPENAASVGAGEHVERTRELDANVEKISTDGYPGQGEYDHLEDGTSVASFGRP